MLNSGYLWMVRLSNICALVYMSFSFFHIKHTSSLIKQELTFSDTIGKICFFLKASFDLESIFFFQISSLFLLSVHSMRTTFLL